MKAKILNSKGEPIVLNAMEQRKAEFLERYLNALGYDIDITTLTTVIKKVTEQKFFEIAPADFVPVKVGEGAWSDKLTTYLSFDLAANFEEGIINTGGNNSRLAQADSGVDSITVPVKNWAKAIGWALPDLMLADKSGNWDLVSSKEKSRKRNWDLGIQKVAFLGLSGSTVKGLLNQSGIETNTTLIQQKISDMSTVDLKAFCVGVVEAYRANCARTAWPTHFAIPESDYNGLAGQASANFPIKSTLQLLDETFKVITRNANFKILPLAYGDAAYNSLGVQKYALYNYEEESLRMDIPVDYTSTLANSTDNFNFQNVAYGQFTGVQAYRPKEMLYFQY